MPLRIAILYGSMREARLGIRAVRFFDGALQPAWARHPALIDAEGARSAAARPACTKSTSAAPRRRRLESLAEIYRNADGFLIVSGEYNHNIQPGLEEPDGLFPRRVFLPALGDRLLFVRRFRRGAGGDDPAHDPCRARHVEHSFDPADPPHPGRLQSGRRPRRARTTSSAASASSASSNGMPRR